MDLANIGYWKSLSNYDDQFVLSKRSDNKKDSIAIFSYTPSAKAHVEPVKNNLISINRKIEPVKQGSIGDCYLLSALNALSSIEQGRKILRDNIKINVDGSYTVDLQGAKQASKIVESEGKKSYISGRYKITTAELLEAKNSKKYSKGDDDVLLYELAYERYRKEVMMTNKINGVKASIDNWELGEYQGRATNESPLTGGLSAEAIYIITGKKAKACYNIPNKKNPVDEKTKNSFFEEYIDKKSVKTYLERIKRNPTRYAVIVGLPLEQPDGKSIYHALHLKSITADNVILINPWNSKEEVVIPRDEFMKEKFLFEIWDTKESSVLQKIKDKIKDFWHNLVD